MKSLLAVLSILVFTFLSCAAAPVESEIQVQEVAATKVIDTCPDIDVWTYIRNDYGHTVIVEVPKRSLEGDFVNCPAKDTRVPGEIRSGIGLKFFHTMGMITIPKGHFNNPKNFTTRPPKKRDIPANNMNLWHAGIIRDY